MLAWIAVALAGQVHEQSIGLESIVPSADAAVVLEVGRPAMTHVEIPIGEGEAKRCGTYAYGVWEGTVREVVRAPTWGPSVDVGDRMVVFPANTPDLLEISLQACLHGGSRSPIFFRYDGSPPADGGAGLVLVRWVPPYGWLETVSGAWLPVRSGKPQVLAIARAERGTRMWPVEPEPMLCVTDADCTLAAFGCAPCATCAPRALHRDSLRHATSQCAAQVEGAPTPTSAPCPTCPPADEPAPSRAVCRAMRCVGAP